MTSNDRQESSSFDSIETERDYWKESYFILETKYQALLSCHSCIDKEEHTQQSLQKRARIESDSSLDPLKILPEPCTRSILSYLSGKELLTIMEVSKYWKEFVESRKFLMNRAMENIIVKPTIKDYSLSLIDQLFDDKTHRNYKHMIGPAILNEKYEISKVVYPIEHYAASLEILKITKINGDYEVKPCVFPKLRKLVVTSSNDRQNYPHLLNFLNKLSLPALTHLLINIDFYDDHPSSYDVQKCLNELPKLETLEIGGLKHDNLENTLHADIHPNQTKVKQLNVSYVDDTSFLQYYQNTLVKFEIDEHLFFSGLQWILQHMKTLKSLSIGVVYGQENEFENIRNETLEILKIGYFEITEGDLQQFQSLFLALPSLREITMGVSLLEENVPEHLYIEIFQFLASHMLNLKRLTCEVLNEEMSLALQLAHEEVGNNPDRYINSTFELILDRAHNSFNEIDKEFDSCYSIKR